MGRFFCEVWRCVRREDQGKLKLLCVVMEWLVQWEVWGFPHHIEEFIEAANEHNIANQEDKLIYLEQG